MRLRAPPPGEDRWHTENALRADEHDVPHAAGRLGTPQLQALVYELLDAHADTVNLAADWSEPRWVAHVDYLRSLQRVGRETLASMEHSR